MAVFTGTQRTYLAQRRLARVATVGADGVPHVTPAGMWQLPPDADFIDVTGHNFAATKKYRDVAATGHAAIVIDDLASTDPWQPRGIEVRGRAEVLAGAEPRIRIHPDRIISCWGLADAKVTG
jgi:pyridoxamine 5'-phosphate oxidase family protein